MNYKRIYDNIINKAKLVNNKIDAYYEVHHILPKCLGGQDIDTNLVSLTLREHYVCHKLLCEIYPENKSLAHAYWMMMTTTLGAMEHLKRNNLYRIDGEILGRINPFLNGERIRISSREYEWCRMHWVKLATGIKRTKEQCKRISDATKAAMRTPERIQKCRANKGSRYYYEIETGIVHKWFPGNPPIDLTKYKLGRGKMSQEQRNKISKVQLSYKTICQIGNSTFRYLWYYDYMKSMPSCFKDIKAKGSIKLKKINILIYKAIDLLKDKGIFIDDECTFNPKEKSCSFNIVSPAVFEICLDILERPNIKSYKDLDVNEIAERIYTNIDKIKELTPLYVNIDKINNVAK